MFRLVTLLILLAPFALSSDLIPEKELEAYTRRVTQNHLVERELTETCKNFSYREWLFCLAHRNILKLCDEQPSREGCNTVSQETNNRCNVEGLVRTFCGYKPELSGLLEVIPLLVGSKNPM